MANFVKIKKRRIVLILFLIFNQFLFNAHALNFRRSDLGYSNRNNFQQRKNKNFQNLFAEKT